MTAFISASLRRYLNLSDLPSVVTAKTNLSLANVDNTSDVNKPVSTAQQTALNLKANLSGGASFSGGNVDVTDAAGRVRMTPSGDITVYRSGGATGYVFLRSAQDRYLGFDGTNYLLPTAPLAVGSAVLVNGSDYVMTRGANETKTGNLIMQGQFTSGVGNALSQDAYVNISGNDNNASYLMIQANGGQRWAFGRPGTTNNLQAYSYGVGGYAFYCYYSTGLVDFNYGITVSGKSAFSHSGSYTSAKVTYSTSAPSGGNDGDLWFQYAP